MWVPTGAIREKFYEARLLESLPWHCLAGPTVGHEAGKRPQQRWEFKCTLPSDVQLSPEQKATLDFSMLDRELVGKPGFEIFCKEIERTFGEADVLCHCCASADGEADRCLTCSHAIGFHDCERGGQSVSSDDDEKAHSSEEKQGPKWKAGTLFSGKLDILTTIQRLAQRCAPREVLKQLLEEAIKDGNLAQEEIDELLEMFEKLAGLDRDTNVYETETAADGGEAGTRPMTKAELRSELDRREKLLQEPPPGVPREKEAEWTDQWRLYQEIVAVLEENKEPARFIIQASAGTGKSFLLETLFLWCAVHGHGPQACAPTGIAAARIHVPRTPVHASTLHYLFGLRGDAGSSLDLTHPEKEDVARLRGMTVLFQDEFSMADDAIWRHERELLAPMARLDVADGAGEHAEDASTDAEADGNETEDSAEPETTSETRPRQQKRHPKTDQFGRRT